MNTEPVIRLHHWVYGDADMIWRDDGLSRIHLGDHGTGCSSELGLADGQRAPLSREVTRRILADPAPTTAREVFDRLAAPQSDAMSRFETLDGKLYRQRGQELMLIRAFTEMEFETICASYVWHLEEAGRWHPSKDQQ